MAETLHKHLEDVPDFDGAGDLQEQGNEAWNGLISAFEELGNMTGLSGQLRTVEQTNQAEKRRRSPRHEAQP